MTATTRPGKFTIDRWQGPHCDSEVVHSPSLAQLDAALSSLDGSRHTLLTLQSDGERHLAVGGGPDRFVVYFTDDNQTFYNLLTAQSRAEQATLQIAAGGQEGDYPADQVVDKNEARAAARFYLSSGERDEGLAWRRD